ncbi:hypothetical protein Tco_1336296 [Tanacetum coccineum]
MPIPTVMLSGEIKAFEDYLNYLAKSTGTQPVKVKDKGKGLLTKKGVEVVVETVRIPKKRRSETVIEETGQLKEAADILDEETLDHSKKLKGVERMSETAKFLLEMKKARKASKEDFILKQQSKGPGEGSGMALEVLDGPSGSSSSSSSEFDDEIEDISSDDERYKADDMEKIKKVEADKVNDDKAEEEKVAEKQTGDVQAKVNVSKPQTKKTTPPLISSSLSLSSAEYDEKVDAETVLKRLKKLERKVKAISKIDHTIAINKSVQAHLKKVLPTAAPGIGKLKPEKAAKQSMPKYSTKPFDDDSLKEYDLKHKLMSLMSKSKSFNTHPAHQELYDALMDSLLVDEDDMDNHFVDPPSLKKRRHDDQDPFIDADKDTKKRRKDSDASSSSKSKDKVASSKEGKDPSKSSKSDKTVDAEATIQDVAVDDEELAHDDVMDAEDLKTPDPKWHKEPTADDAPEHNKFNEMVNVENDPDTFDDLMGSTVDFTKNYIELEYNMKQCYLAFTYQIDWVNPKGDRFPYDLSKPLPLQGPPGRTTIHIDFFFNKDLESIGTDNALHLNFWSQVDHGAFNIVRTVRSKGCDKDLVKFDDMMGSTVDFTKFAKHCLKKDKITKANLEGPAFNLLKGNYRSYIELEYNMKQCYLAFTYQIDWVNPKGDRFPYDLSKPLPLQGPPGRTTIHIDFFFNKDLEFSASCDKQFGYGYLKEIVVRRADQKEYVFKEADFPKLYLNDIEDMYLMYAQNKLHHLKGDEQTDLTKLNITRPQVRCDGLDAKEPYTILHEPRGVVYLNKNNDMYLMRADELYNFSDGTLKPVRDILNSWLHNFSLGYDNASMPKRAWTEKDSFHVEKDRLNIAGKTDYEELRVLFCGRKIETDYRLLTRTE